MKPLLLLPCVLFLISAAMLHIAIMRESWPVSVIYRIPQAQEIQAVIEPPDYEPEEIYRDDPPDDPPDEPEALPDPAPVFPLNLNSATREELIHIPGIGDVLSGRIVQYRDHIGGYTELSQLTNIHGISQNTLERIGGYFVIGPY